MQDFWKWLSGSNYIGLVKYMVNNQLYELHGWKAVVSGDGKSEEQNSQKQDSFETNISTVYKPRKIGMQLSIETTVY